MGKTLLALLDGPALDAELQRPRQVRTLHTITGREALERELEKVRVAGVAIDDQENELGVRCIGAAIVDGRGRGIAAISVSAPEARMPFERCVELAPAVRAAADEIGRRIGRSALR
jgi:DNA-binding IclR family transcriptional regulator